MRISVKGFGPIRYADIDVKPLTVFVGPNAAGKSYLLYLIWALLYVEPDWDMLVGILNQRLAKIFESDADKDALSTELKGVYTDFLKRFNELFAENLKLLLKDTFMVSRLRELIHKDFDVSEILIYDVDNEPAIRILIDGESDSVRVTVEENIVRKIESRLGISVDIKGNVIVTIYYDIPSNEPIYSIALLKDDFRRSLDELGESIPFVIPEYLEYCPNVPVVILPDGRAGILRSADPLAKSLLSLRWKESPMVNAVDREFFRMMFASTPRIKNEDIAKIADFIEGNLGYKFVYDYDARRIAVVDEARGVKLSIDRAPSGLRELAPLVYTMRYVLDKGYNLLVEEPEAHLHPDAQSIIVRALAMLSKKGIDVVITTHSVHVLDEIHALLRVASLRPEQRKELGYLEDEGLEPEDVAVYMVSEDGSVTCARITPEGIEETFLDRVYRELANRYARIEQLLERSEAK